MSSFTFAITSFCVALLGSFSILFFDTTTLYSLLDVVRPRRDLITIPDVERLRAMVCISRTERVTRITKPRAVVEW